MILDGRNIRVEARTSLGNTSGSTVEIVRRAVGHETLSIAPASVRANHRSRVESTSEPERVPEAVEHTLAPEVPQDSQDSQDPQNSQASQSSQDAIDVPASQDSQASQGSQDSEDIQASQSSQDTPDVPVSQYSQASQDSHGSEDSQASQNFQDAQDVPVSQDPQASEDSQASQNSQDARDVPVFQDPQHPQDSRATEALVAPTPQVTATEPAQMVESQAQLVQPTARHTVPETVGIAQTVEPASVAISRATPEVAMPRYTDTHARVDMGSVPGHHPGMAPYPPPCYTPPGYFVPGQHSGGFLHAPGFHGNGMYPPYYPYGHGPVPYPGFCPPMGYYPYPMPYGPMGGAYGSTTASSTPPPPIHTPDTQTHDTTRVDAGPGVHQG